MTINLQPVKGTRDLLPNDYAHYKHVVDITENIANNYGFKTMMIPIFEFTEIFKRTLGDSSDVVSKEMYSFDDKGDRNITLRPEFTAGIARSIISNSLSHNLPLKYFTHGPLFRYEQPQAGRYRQFHQINLEYIGNNSPFADSEIIAMAAQILEELGIINDTNLELNSLGDKESKNSYLNALTEYFKKYEQDLSKDSQIRLYKNPLRILDSKSASDKEISVNAPIYKDYYTKEAANFFDQVCNNLEKLNIKYELNPRLVRGLDYYSHTAFEFTTNKLGAQGSVMGGGRYDELLAIMGAKAIPSVGFAAGIERLVSLMNYKSEQNRPIALIALDTIFEMKILSIAQILRKNNYGSEIIYGGDVAKKMKYANKINSKFAIFIGEEEDICGNIKFKDLDSREEHTIKQDEFLNNLKKYINN